MSDLDVIREAVEHDLEPSIAELIGPSSGALYARTRAAARRFLALTETGPDYEAAAKTLARQDGFRWDAYATKYQEGWIKRATEIVDAALADYLTEEE